MDCEIIGFLKSWNHTISLGLSLAVALGCCCFYLTVFLLLLFVPFFCLFCFFLVVFLFPLFDHMASSPVFC